MSNNQPNSGTTIRPERLAQSWRVDQVCEEFESTWRNGQTSRLKEMVEAAREDDRLRVLEELLALDLEFRFRHQQSPSLATYQAQFPDQAELVAEVFGRVAADGNESLDREARLAEIQPVEADRYKIGDEIARGGMGLVVRCRDLVLARVLALKTLLPENRDVEQATLRFVNEAKITARLQHPGVPPVHELGRLEDGRPFLTMRLVSGQTLASILSHDTASEAASQRALLDIFLQVCQTVAYAHEQGVVHRDLKPSNVMVGAFDEVQVMDWGLARELDAAKHDDPLPRTELAGGDDNGDGTMLLDSVDVQGSMKSSGPKQIASGHSTETRTFASASLADASVAIAEFNDSALTSPGAILGTLYYMPPEQARGEAALVDQRADVFSLGAILCEILTGVPPVKHRTADEDSPNVAAQIKQIASGQLDAAVDKLQSCGADQELAKLACDCIEHDPAARPTDARQVARRLRQHLFAVDERLKQAELEGAEAEARLAEAARRARLLRILVGLTVLVAIGSGIAAIAFQNLASEKEAASIAASMQQQVAEQAQGRAESAEATAEQDRDRAREKETEAREAEQRAESVLVTLHTRSGLTAAEQHKSQSALLSFALAQRLADDERNRWGSRVRFRTFGREVATPYAFLKHDGRLDSITFHPSQPFLLVRFLSQTPTAIWNLQTETPITLPADLGTIHTANWNADGSRLAVGNANGDWFLCEFSCQQGLPDAPTRIVPLQRGHMDGPISHVQFDNSGRLLAVAARNSVRIWDSETESLLPEVWKHPESVLDVQFNPTRHEFVTCCADNRFRVFALNSLQFVLDGPHFCDRRGTTRLRPILNPDGSRLMTVDEPSNTNKRTQLIFWDLVARTENARDMSHSGFPFGMRVDRRGKRVAVAGTTGVSVMGFDGSIVMPWHGNRYMYTVDFALNGMLTTGGHESSAALWNPENGGTRIGSVAPSTSHIFDLKYSPNGRLLACAEGDGTIRVWENPPHQINRTTIGTTCQYSVSEFSADGRHLVARGSAASSVHSRIPLQVFSTRTRKPVGSAFECPTVPYCKFSPVDDVLACVSQNAEGKTPGGVITFWDWMAGKLRHAPTSFATKPLVCAFRPDGARLAVLSRDGTLTLVDTSNGKVLTSWQSGYRDIAIAMRLPFLAWANDGQTLLTMHAVDAVMAWDVQAQKPRFAPMRHQGFCSHAEVSPDGMLLATAGGDRMLKLWDVQTGKLAVSPMPHPGIFYSLAFSKNGQMIACGCRDNRAHTWSVKTGTRAGPSIAAAEAPFVGWAADDRALLVAARHVGQFAIYDYQTGLALAPAEKLPGVASMGVDPTGRYAAVGASAPKMYVLDLNELSDTPALQSQPTASPREFEADRQFDSMSPDELVTWAELIANLKVSDDGTTSHMTSEEWRDQWQEIQRKRGLFLRP